MTFYSIGFDEEIDMIARQGWLVNKQNKPEQFNKNDWCIPLPKPDAQKGILVKITSPITIKSTLFGYFSNADIEDANRKEMLYKERWQERFIIGFIAILLLLLIRSALLSLNGKKAQIFYGLFLFSTCIYTVEQFEYNFSAIIIFSYVVQWHFSYEIPLVTSIYVFYTLFIKEFLREQFSELAHQVIKYGIWLMVLLAIIDVIVREMFGTSASMTMYKYSKIVLILFLACFLLFAPMFKEYTSKENKKMYAFILTGAFCLFVGAYTSLCVNIYAIEHLSIWGHHLNYTRIGMVLEAIVFTAALAYKAKIQEQKLYSRLKEIASKNEVLTKKQKELSQIRSRIKALELGNDEVPTVQRGIYYDLSNGNITHETTKHTQVPIGSILFIESKRNDFEIITTMRSYRIRKPYDIESLLQKLGQYDFVQIHRDFLVNIHQIEGLSFQIKNTKGSGGEVYVKNKEYLPISRGKKAALKKRIIEAGKGDLLM